MLNRVYYAITTRQCRQRYSLTQRTVLLPLLFFSAFTLTFLSRYAGRIVRTATGGWNSNALEEYANLPPEVVVAVSGGSDGNSSSKTKEGEVEQRSVKEEKDEKEGQESSKKNDGIRAAAGIPKKTNARGKKVSCGAHYAASCEECTKGNGASWCNGDCAWDSTTRTCTKLSLERLSKLHPHVHPKYMKVIKEYPFQPVKNQKGDYINVILVRSPLQTHQQKDLFLAYRDQILFLGISSYESFPLSSPNPFSANFSNVYYTAMFEGWLHMMHEPDLYFPKDVKRILLSQSDFSLGSPLNYEKRRLRKLQREKVGGDNKNGEAGNDQHDNNKVEKIYDFTFSGTDQDVAHDCVGWSSFAKNWTLVKQALEVICSDPELQHLKGVLVATKNKQNTKACTLPPACYEHGNILQTTFLSQDEFFEYVIQSKFVFVPQIYDASPRVTTQALSMNVPLLMNRHIMGGWKYLSDPRNGEFFTDITDFKSSLQKLLGNLDTYKPREYVEENLGDEISGKKLLDFVVENWKGDSRVKIPEGTRLLLPSGA